MNLVSQIISLLDGKQVAHKRGTYACEVANEAVVVFRETSTTGRVMLPTDLVLEWVQAYEFGLIHIDDTARAMREKVVSSSRWAPFQHGFETHLAAIVAAWDERERKAINRTRSRQRRK
jgi:hypothetical protein